MDDSLGGMFKLTGSNYSVWKSKMRDMLVVKDLWLSVQFGDEKPEKIDAAVWEVMHMKTNCVHSVLHRHEPIQQLQRRK